MEAVGKLAGGIAHDFNNLLVVILGNSEMLENDLEKAPELREKVREISRAGEKAARLTAQLLAFSRRQDLRPAVVDLHGIVEDLGRMIRRLVGEDITMVFKREEDPLPVKVDPGQIEQVILNLVTNARDAMPGGGTLTLSTVQEDESAVLRVVDSGAGMSEKVLARALEPFFSTKPVGRGTGLGLSSAYGIVKQSGGDIRMTSQEGKGTTVEVVLPLSRRQPEPRKPPVRRPARSDRTGTILVVEDDPGVAGIIRAVLTREGYSVRESGNGGAALRCVEEHGSELRMVLTDVVMPLMSGPELARRLRESRPDLPVLFMSGYTDDMLASQGLSLEEVELIRKPFSPTELAEAVEHCLAAWDQAPGSSQKNERQDM